MRCARCDHLAIPQALGRSPNGQLVYGWCLECLEEEGCTEIQIAKRSRNFRHPHQPSSHPMRAMVKARSRVQGIVGLLLLIWGAVLTLGALWKTAHPSLERPSPTGNGTPALLFVGGAALGTTGLVFLSVALARMRWFWRVLEVLFFLCALGVLVAGIVQHDPRRDPWLVALAGFALGLSVMVRWRQRFHFLNRHAADAANFTRSLQNNGNGHENAL